ncbi:MAG: beta-ketoacyl-ACP synthase III [Acidobacteriota bacterium]
MSQIIRSVIAGTGSALPDKVMTNFDLEKIVDTSDEWITTRTGIKERRIAEEGEYMSTFATGASRKALEMAGIDAADVDLIICGTVTPDMPIPSTACFIQENLGAKRAACFDMAAGCSGFIYGLEIANQFITTGTFRNILVIGAELLSKFLDWTDRTTCVIFADGAGAALVTRGEAPRGILASCLRADGKMADFICLPGGGTRYPPSEKTYREGLQYIRMKGNETFKIAVRSLEEVSREVLRRANLTPDQVDLFVPHQANRRIIDAVGVRLGVDPDRVYVNVDRVGNTSAASIPIAMDEAVRANRVKPGDIILFAAFGAGLTWGATLLRW